MDTFKVTIHIHTLKFIHHNFSFQPIYNPDPLNKTELSLNMINTLSLNTKELSYQPEIHIY